MASPGPGILSQADVDTHVDNVRYIKATALEGSSMIDSTKKGGALTVTQEKKWRSFSIVREQTA
jgi:hypothetical protein